MEKETDFLAMKLKQGLRDGAIERFNYDLSKKVPNMAKGFRIQTDYGDISISAADAPAFVELAEQAMIKKINERKKMFEAVPGPAAVLK